MLVEFKIGNYLSFNDPVTFSMVGSNPIKEHESDNSFSNTFLDPSEKLKLLKSSVIYGANGSGKSNLISAMSFFRDFILISSNEKQSTDDIKVLRFLLSSANDNQPSYFEMIFFINDIRYRYGFEVDKTKVATEWFFALPNNPSAKETRLFIREYQKISINKQSFKEGKGLEDKTRPNALFLSTVAQLNGEISTLVRTWFKTNFIVISGLDDKNYASFTIEKSKNEPKFKTQLIEFFKAIRIGFEDIEIVEEDKLIENLIMNNLPKEMPMEMQEILKDLKELQDRMKNLQNTRVESKTVSINFLHRKFDEANNFLELVIIDYGLQSKGTQKLFNIFGLWIDAIENGKIIIVDELDSRLHTLLAIELIKFFHLTENTKAQLIFASHDTNLLKKEYFRRDQIWFCEKNDLGATDLYSLVEYYKISKSNIIRNDASFEKDYLLGKYGAIPFLGDIHKFTNDFIYEQREKQSV